MGETRLKCTCDVFPGTHFVAHHTWVFLEAIVMRMEVEGGGFIVSLMMTNAIGEL